MQEIKPELETTAAPSTSGVRLTPVETAERLSMSVQRLATWRHDGSGPPYIKLNGTGKIFYLASDVDAYVMSCRVIPQKKSKMRTAKKAPRRKKGGSNERGRA